MGSPKIQDWIFPDSCFQKLHEILYLWAIGMLKVFILFCFLSFVSIPCGIFIRNAILSKTSGKDKGFGSLPSKPVPEFHAYEDDESIVPVRKISRPTKKQSMTSLLKWNFCEIHVVNSILIWRYCFEIWEREIWHARMPDYSQRHCLRPWLCGLWQIIVTDCQENFLR